MTYSQIRINKTKDIQKVLGALKIHFSLLSEAEIVKMLLSEAYYKFSIKGANEAPRLIEMTENEISPELQAKIDETKKMKKSEFINI